MTSQVKVPKDVKQETLAKWATGKSCTKENWQDWWYDDGIKLNTFCFYFKTLDIPHIPMKLSEKCGSDSTGMCPLHDNGSPCAKELDACFKAYLEDDYSAFIAAASAMYDRIVAVPEMED